MSERRLDIFPDHPILRALRTFKEKSAWVRRILKGDLAAPTSLEQWKEEKQGEKRKSRL
jgi:hypothetical protein